ncbi:MAG: DNA polymerase III subunit epsilon [Gammaproteobacteria bacterium]|nr:DNA polymerase III subunit epsilon [Gammaproteobacteria bacterium]
MTSGVTENRLIVLDTETTGLEPSQGHRIIEIGCVEMIDRRLTGNNFHQYIQPDREIDSGAVEVHGISNDFLKDKPRFGDLVDDLMSYLSGATLVIHNAAFDIGFLNQELRLLGGDRPAITDRCGVIDTLALAKQLHPGQRNSLDALCKRYAIDNSHRELHGALLDAEILAEVYLAMTGGQTALSLEAGADGSSGQADGSIRRLSANRPVLTVIRVQDGELKRHEAFLERLEKQGERGCLWMTGRRRHTGGN